MGRLSFDFDITRFLADHDLSNTPDRNSSESVSQIVCDSGWEMPGFHGTTRVSTTFGELPIMGLRVRDRVRTISGEYKPVKWIKEIRFDREFLERTPEAQPIRIGREALGENCPETDILLSPAQELSVSTVWSRRMLRSARDLLSRPNVGRARETNVSYYVFHCGGTDIVRVGGVWCQVSSSITDRFAST